MSKVQVVWFRDLKLWDLKSNLFDNEMFANSKFPLVQVSTFLHRNKTPIKIQNNETYKRVTIKTKGQGCHLRDTLKGSLIGTKNQFLIKEGQFLISKIDARNGAFGVVSQDIHNAIITGNFWTYDIDESKVNAYFLALFTSTQYFINFCKACSGGTTGRHYLDENKFLNAKIPLPPLKIQKQIVAKIESIKAQIKALQEEEKRLKDEIEAYIYIALGLEKKQEAKRQKVFIVRFKDLDRWDTRHNQSIAINLKNAKSQVDSTSISVAKHDLESVVGVGDTQGGGSDFAIQAPPPCEKENTESKKDISAQYDKPINTANLKALLDSIPTPPPHGWEVKTLGEICEITAGGDKPLICQNLKTTECQIPIFANGKQNNGLYGYTDKPTITQNALTISARGTIGYAVARFEPFFPIVRLLVCIPKKEVNLLYLQHYINFSCIMNSGSNIPQFTIPEAKQIKIPLPPLSVQEKIVAHIQKIGSSIATTQEKSKALELELTHYIESTL